jgi:hypothetical protein
LPPEVIPLTPQEEQLLNSLVQRVNQTQLQEKDPDAEALLNQQLGPNPDALYILAQTVLVQNIALDQARAQVAQLQPQTQHPPAHATTFLGRLLGDRDPASASPQPPPYQPVNPQFSPQPPQYAAPQYQSQYQPQFVPVGQPSFLRGAMQTAAGVAAGALAFEGVESILHGIGGHGGYGWGGPGVGMGGFGRPEETIINNNYYDEPGAHGSEHGGEHHGLDSGNQNPDQSLADPAAFNNLPDNQDNLVASGFDDSSNYDADLNNADMDDQADLSGLDDTGGFDDGDGFDSSGDSV